MVVVPAVDHDHEHADPDHTGKDGNCDLAAAQAAHLISKLIASALSSLFGTKPRAPVAPIASPRSAESWLETSTICGCRAARAQEPPRDLEPIEVGQPHIEQHEIGT